MALWDDKAGPAGSLPVLVAAALSVFVLYAPQPLLPFFAELYGVSESEAALLMAVTMLPLAAAPLSCGYLFRFVTVLRVLRASLLTLGSLTLLMGLDLPFAQLLLVRFGQGLCIPAALTAVMAHLAAAGRGGTLQRGMSMYVAATIVGGFLGRLLAGLTSAVVDWHFFYLLLGAGIIGGSLVIRPEKVERGTRDTPPSVGVPAGTLRDVVPCLPVYLSVFCLFFVFCGSLNYLPFRVVELTGFRSDLLAGVMYGGYLTGIGTAMGAGRFIRLAGSAGRVMISGYLLFLLVLAAMLLPWTGGLFALLFPFCGAMFLVHTVATAVVNRTAGDSLNLASGVYVSSYYSGGVAGMYVPGLVFERYGWEGMIVGMLGVCIAGLLPLLVFFRPGQDSDREKSLPGRMGKGSGSGRLQ